MNLLFDFLKNLGEPELARLAVLKSRGNVQQVWQLINLQVKEGAFSKDKLLKDAGISAAHLDKITSELLAKCYETLFGDDKIALLDLLSLRLPYLKHFYSELTRQMKQVETELTPERRYHFYVACFDLMQANLPIAYRDEKVLKKLAAKSLSLFKGERKKHVALLVDCKLIINQTAKLFAAAEILAAKDTVEKKIDALGKLPETADEKLTFEYYWTKIYFYHAIEKFAECLELSYTAAATLKKFKSEVNTLQVMRIDLRAAELLYYLSKFEESFITYKNVMRSPLLAKIPERGYHTAKYLQVCLVTDNIKEAEEILTRRKKAAGDQLEKLLAPRDIFLFIKYYLFSGDYDDAFHFIQLGFEKNPKGQYFQYEVELRCLQTAYFFLTGQQEIAIEGCERHIKYLRSHGYGASKSDYPHFYILTKAIFDKKTSGQAFSVKQEKMLERYQKGSFALYGKLLNRMLNS